MATTTSPLVGAAANARARPTPETTIAGYVSGFEGLLSLQPADNGNWYDPVRYAAKPKALPQRRGCGVLVGSMRGITAYTLVEYRLSCGWPLSKAMAVGRSDMSAIDLKTAVAIGLALFFNRPGLRYLAWNRVTASILDKAWGSGARATIVRLQQLIGAKADGVITDGGETVRLYAAWLAKLGEDGAARAWCAARHTWDAAIASNEGPNDPDRVFLAGWGRRSDSFLPGSPWWSAWA